MRLTRPTRALLTGAAFTVALVFGWQAIAAASGGDSDRASGVRQMQRLMDSQNPVTERMHERMMQNAPARHAHDSMMQDRAMAQMHGAMMGTTASPGS